MRRVVTADGLATGRVEGLVLLAGDLVRIGTAQAFELQVLFDCVVQQSHVRSLAYSARTVLFLPARLAS